jgi:LPS-assembly lipoprotein|tara:strand:- start:103 stop:585 length:483 start_codon:yes stop_codon:yes gene_type:complete
MKLNTILISALFILSSCGYSMRGSVNIPSSITSVSVISSEYSELVNILNSSLTSSNIETSISMGNDLYRIAILSEKFNRRQLSINISGRVNEYELIYDVNFELKIPNEKPMKDRVTLYRDYSFDENNVMGNSDREDDIKKGMISTASTLIFNKLIALTRK